MGRKPLDPVWRERVRFIAATEEGVSQKEIERRLEREGRDEKRTDAPSLRTIRRYLRAFPPAEREKYTYFYWPESMGSVALPWSASRDALDLLAQWQRAGRGRPIHAIVTAYLQILQALPREQDPILDADREPLRLQMAGLLAAIRLCGGKSYTENLRGMERSLALSRPGTELSIRIPTDVAPLFEAITNVPITGKEEATE